MHCANIPNNRINTKIKDVDMIIWERLPQCRKLLHLTILKPGQQYQT